jgi:hypothetical protein
MLHLHPDKQPPGQSVEEAMRIEQLMYDVMKARSFLLDVEYMAARRQYDSKLMLAKQSPLLPPQKLSGVKQDKHYGNKSKQYQTEQEEEAEKKHYSKKTELLPPQRSSATADVGGWGRRPSKSWRTTKKYRDPAPDNDNDEAAIRRDTKYNCGEKSRQRRSTMSNDTSYGEDKHRQRRSTISNDTSSSDTNLNHHTTSTMNIKRLGTSRKSSSLIRRTAVSAKNANKKKVVDSSSNNDNEKAVPTTINNVKRWGKNKQSSSSLRRAANVNRKVDSNNKDTTTRNGIT